tara:strand:- start:2428 stop:2631 length:204 start_codon:yes stop_codon:yes gene_type:complete
MDVSASELKRWFAVVVYRGGNIKLLNFDELADLHDLIEEGPNFYLIRSITIHTAHEGTELAVLNGEA